MYGITLAISRRQNLCSPRRHCGKKPGRCSCSEAVLVFKRMNSRAANANISAEVSTDMTDAYAHPPVLLEPPGARNWVQISPADCKHHYASRGMILEAAKRVTPGQTIILGAGRCQEIPLVELAERFERVILNDHDESLLVEGLKASGLVGDLESRIQPFVADLTGVTGDFLRRVSEYLPSSSDPESAAGELAAIAEAARPKVIDTGQTYDLVIASCVLCQLHVDACNRASELFEARFPGHGQFLRRCESWFQAVYRMARRFEQNFIDTTYSLVAPGGASTCRTPFREGLFTSRRRANGSQTVCIG